jgi:hypothetical protein
MSRHTPITYRVTRDKVEALAFESGTTVHVSADETAMFTEVVSESNWYDTNGRLVLAGRRVRYYAQLDGAA